jgi:putative FmdB family regulatory protein
MPTYEYKCESCEEAFEIFQKISEPTLKECPVCGGRLKKLISGGVGIIFKGSGFYTTDYKSSSTSSISSPESRSDAKTTGKTEEKKAAKKDPESSPKAVSSDNK